MKSTLRPEEIHVDPDWSLAGLSGQLVEDKWDSFRTYSVISDLSQILEISKLNETELLDESRGNCVSGNFRNVTSSSLPDLE